jgi:uncharacterized membrane protein YeaQ/YmgE (transglycosylase-associated protein family)
MTALLAQVCWLSYRCWLACHPAPSSCLAALLVGLLAGWLACRLASASTGPLCWRDGFLAAVPCCLAASLPRRLAAMLSSVDWSIIVAIISQVVIPLIIIKVLTLDSGKKVQDSVHSTRYQQQAGGQAGIKRINIKATCRVAGMMIWTQLTKSHTFINLSNRLQHSRTTEADVR